jgi:phage tail sheath protein FI
MPRPGTDVVILDESAPGGPSLNTGQAFFVGITASGPTTSYGEIHSLKQYRATYGDRTGGPKMFDAVNSFFQEGGGTAFVANIATADAAGVEPALALFTYELGPGQVCAPGLTDPLVHEAVLDHIDATHRCALLDSAGGDKATLLAEVAALEGKPGVRFAALLAPQLSYPDPSTGAPVDVPYSGVQAGLIARADILGNPNQAAAGVNGISRLALGLADDYTDDDREAINEAGVTLAKMVYGDVRTYGARTCAGPDDANWLWFPNSRVVMAVTHEADAIAQTYLFRQVDGRRQLFAALETDLRAMLLRYFQIGALYGMTPAEAFGVDTGVQINTDETIAAGEVHAALRIKTSPTAEYVEIAIVKVALELPIAA